MMEFLPYLILIIGFIVLIFGGSWLVDGASSLAKRFGISNLVIGLTVVAFGTSAPELVVNIFASLSGSTDIALGNIVGSNIVNILFIGGLTAIISPIVVNKGTLWKEIPFMFLATIILFITAQDALIDGMSFSLLTRSDGMIFLGFFIVFLYYTFGIAKVEGEVDEKFEKKNIWTSLTMVFGGLLALFFGGKWVVDSSVDIARLWGMSESVIGLTIVAIGTSLPELVTSIIAGLKKNVGIVIGNIVGSNIFNILFVLGVSSAINSIPLPFGGSIDMLVVLFASLILFLSFFIGKKGKLDRWQGIIFVLLYIAYIIYLIQR